MNHLVQQSEWLLVIFHYLINTRKFMTLRKATFPVASNQYESALWLESGLVIAETPSGLSLQKDKNVLKRLSSPLRQICGSWWAI